MSEYYFILHLIYYTFVESYPSSEQDKRDFEEKGVVKNQILHDKTFKNKTLSTLVEKSKIEPIAWEMRDIYSGYSQDKEIRLDMDGQYLTREISFSQELQQKLKKGELKPEELSQMLKQAIDDAASQITITTLLKVGDREIFLKDYLQLITNHFNYKDLWQEIDDANKDRFALNFEAIEELEDKHQMPVINDSEN